MSLRDRKRSSDVGVADVPGLGGITECKADVPVKAVF